MGMRYLDSVVNDSELDLATVHGVPHFSTASNMGGDWRRTQYNNNEGTDWGGAVRDL